MTDQNQYPYGVKLRAVSLDAEQRLAEDLSCVGCGYNLRAMTLQANCPECGRLARTSLLLPYIQWLNRMRTATWLLFAWLVLSVLWMVGRVLYDLAMSMFQVLVLPSIVNAFLACVGFVALWRLTRPQPLIKSRGDVLRRIARVTSLVLPLMVVSTLFEAAQYQMAMYGIFYFGIYEFEVLHAAFEFIAAACYVTTLLLLGMYALQLNHPKLGVQAMILASVAALPLLLGPVLEVYTDVYFASSDDSLVFSRILIWTWVVSGLILLAVTVWALVLLPLFARMFRKQAAAVIDSGLATE